MEVEGKNDGRIGKLAERIGANRSESGQIESNELNRTLLRIEQIERIDHRFAERIVRI